MSYPGLLKQIFGTAVQSAVAKLMYSVIIPLIILVAKIYGCCDLMVNKTKLSNLTGIHLANDSLEFSVKL